MKVETTDELLALLSMLEERGAARVSFAFADGGEVQSVSIDYRLKPPATHTSNKKPVSEREEMHEQARIPAGLGMF
jgi:hypothetical protein